MKSEVGSQNCPLLFGEKKYQAQYMFYEYINEKQTVWVIITNVFYYLTFFLFTLKMMIKLAQGSGFRNDDR